MIALIPVNELARAKGRLAPDLSPEDRAKLALATLATVLESASGAGLEPVVVTRDPAVAAAVSPVARVLDEDPAFTGLNPQLESAVARLGQERPLAELLVLHADLPLASAAALRDLLAAAPPAPSVTMVRSPDGGTNAMFLRPPGGFALAYGPASFARHEAAATAAGYEVRALSSPELELDLDTPADLDDLMRTPRGPETRAGRLLTTLVDRGGAAR